MLYNNQETMCEISLSPPKPEYLFLGVKVKSFLTGLKGISFHGNKVGLGTCGCVFYIKFYIHHLVWGNDQGCKFGW